MESLSDHDGTCRWGHQGAWRSKSDIYSFTQRIDQRRFYRWDTPTWDKRHLKYQQQNRNMSSVLWETFMIYNVRFLIANTIQSKQRSILVKAFDAENGTFPSTILTICYHHKITLYLICDCYYMDLTAQLQIFHSIYHPQGPYYRPGVFTKLTWRLHRCCTNNWWANTGLSVYWYIWISGYFANLSYRDLNKT